MPKENTLTATAGTTAETTVDVAQLQAALETANQRIATLEAQLQRRDNYQASYAQQLFLKNLGMVNSPSITKAWEETEEQLKFLASKGVI
jgi:predicted  nucleic acid-binding Zn-ribbon protein